MVTIDGSTHEGGGQIVRSALGLSLHLRQFVEITKIRAGRTRPGLKAQHLHCIKALQMLSRSREEGAELGSTRLRFYPFDISSKNISIDIGTAGSITLLLQCLLLPCVLSGKRIKLEITGGTDVAWSPQATYFEQVVLPQMQRFATVQFRLIKRGYYPKGGGKVEVIIRPKEQMTTMIDLVDQGKVLQVKGVSHASIDLEPSQVAERTARAAELVLSKLGCPVTITTEYSNSESTGSGITLWAICSRGDEIDFMNPIRLGADVLGERGKKAEEVGAECATQLITEIESGAAVDSHLADHLIPFLALFGGQVKTSAVSSHTTTNIWACEEFLGERFTVEGSTIVSLLREGENKTDKSENKCNEESST